MSERNAAILRGQLTKEIQIYLKQKAEGNWGTHANQNKLYNAIKKNKAK